MAAMAASRASQGKHGFPLMLLMLLSCMKGGLAQNIVVSPVNTAGEIGSPAQLNCTANLMGDSLAWQEFTSGAAGARIFTSPDTYGPGMESKYEVIPGAVGQFDLEIKNPAYNLAGQYRCFLPVTDVGPLVDFVAVSPVTCGRNPSNTEYLEGSYLSLTCDIQYNGYKAPTLAIYNSNGLVPSTLQYIPETQPSPNTRIRATANITALYTYDGMNFECRVDFQKNASNPQDTAVPPTFTSNCTQNFQVVYGARDMCIEPNPDDYDEEMVVISVGDQLNCSAMGNPPPDFYWYGEGPDQGIIRHGQVLVINEKMVGVHTVRCEASNVIQGNPRKVSMNVTFNAVYPPGYNVAGAKTPGWVVAIAVIIPLLVIAGVLLGVFFYYRKKHGLPLCYSRMDKNPPPPTSPRSNGQLHLDLTRSFPPPVGAASEPQVNSPPVQSYPYPQPAPRADPYPMSQQQKYMPSSVRTPSLSENSFDSGSQQGRTTYSPTGVPVYPPADGGVPLREVKKKKRRSKHGDQATPGSADIYGSTHSLSKMTGNSDVSDPTIGTGSASREAQGGAGAPGYSQGGPGGPSRYYSANV